MYLVKVCVVYEFHVNHITIESNTQLVDQNTTAWGFVSYSVMVNLTNCSENILDVLKTFSIPRN